MAWSFPSGKKLLGGIGIILGNATGSFTKYIIFAGILAVGGAAFYWYYNDTQDRLKANADLIAKQEIADAIQKSTIDQMQIDLETHKYILKEVYKDLAEANKQTDVDPFQPVPVTPVVPVEPGSAEEDIRNELGGTEEELNRNYNNSTKCFELYSRDKKDEDDKQLRADCGLSD